MMAFFAESALRSILQICYCFLLLLSSSKLRDFFIDILIPTIAHDTLSRLMVHPILDSIYVCTIFALELICFDLWLFFRRHKRLDLLLLFLAKRLLRLFF